jgi:hypothetical protein
VILYFDCVLDFQVKSEERWPVRPTGLFGFKSQFVPLLNFLKFYSLGFYFSRSCVVGKKPLILLRGFGLRIDWW